MNLGNKIKRLRKMKNLSQEELADILNVPPHVVDNWEQNIALPTTGEVVEMSKLFNCSTDYLLKTGDHIRFNGTVASSNVSIPNPASKKISLIIEIIATIISFIITLAIFITMIVQFDIFNKYGGISVPLPMILILCGFGLVFIASLIVVIVRLVKKVKKSLK